MKPYIVSLVAPEDLQLFSHIRNIVAQMPEIDLGVDKNGNKIVVSCHMLARAFAAHFYSLLDFRDGYFSQTRRHSWLLRGEDLLIDPYPVGMLGGPIMVHTRFFPPWKVLYQEAQLDDLETPEFLRSVASVIEVMETTVETLGPRI